MTLRDLKKGLPDRVVPYHSIEHFGIGYKLFNIPNISIKWHEFNEANIDWSLACHLYEITNLIIIETPHHNTIHLEHIILRIT